MNRQYLDFELEIRDGQAGYEVAVVKSPAGETRAPMTVPFGELELKNNLLALENALLRSGGKRRRILTREEETVRRFGQTLFEMAMTGAVGSLYYESQREAAHGGKGLRVKLRVNPPELAVLPWEFLYDPRRDEYICLSSHTPLVRYPEVAQQPLPLPVTPPLRILGMIASPEGVEPLDVALEQQRVETALAALQADGLVELTWLPGQSWRDLLRALRRGTWHIFHFIGHGSFDPGRDEGVLLLADDAGKAAPITASQLGQLLANHRALRLVLLNSCEGARGSDLDVFSSTAATLMRRGLPAVVAMQYEITDGAAIEFVQTFYESVADGLPVDTSVAEARVSVSLAVANTLEWGTPVLYMRAPNGEIFTIGELPAPPLRREEGAADVAPERQQKPEPKPVRRRIPVVEMDWVEIPAGEFLMGSGQQQDRDASNSEFPQHRLSLPAYRIGRTPVTVAQFEAFVKATGYEFSIKQDVTTKGDHPVTDVSWYDARAYCEWLSQELEQEIRLPTEAEWEKAARGADGRIYPWGNEAPDESRCKFNMNMKDTIPVGKYPRGASPYGVLDMVSYVLEWTSTVYEKYPYDKDDGREDLEAPGSRVLRGSSFGDNRRSIRCAVRNGRYPVIRSYDVGFRVLSPGL